MQKAVIYARVSTQEQADSGYSIDVQLEKLNAYANLHNLKIVNKYIDAGVSGAKYDRPALDDLKNNIDKIDIVLVYKLDRLSRSMKDTMILIEDVFKPNNVRLVSLLENFDTSSAMGMATVGMLSTFAQLERETIKERMISGKVQSVKNGNFINHAPYGYKKKNGKLVKNEKQAKVVEFIFKELLAGKSIATISRRMTLQKFDTELKEKWYPTTISRISKNRTYLGHTFLMGQEVKHTHEAYISEEDFIKISYMLNERNYRKSAATIVQYPALFRGLIKCNVCGRRLTVCRRKYQDHYYRCTNCKRDGMRVLTVTEKIMELKFLDYLNNIDMHVSKEKSEIEIIDYSTQLKEIDKKTKKITNAWFNDMLDDMEFKRLKEELEKSKNEILREQNKQNSIADSVEKKDVIKNLILNFKEIWEGLEYKDKTELIKGLIDYIDIDIIKEWRLNKCKINNIVFK